MQKPARSIVLADANNFYVSCESLFRPDLKRDGKVVVVLSNNDGAVVARSAEAKAIGVKMGEPFFMLRDLAKKYDIYAFSSNYSLYADMSNRMMSVLGAFSPVQEIYSIDESFLDFTGCHDIRERAYAMREQVKRHVGLIVGVGIGPTKTLAKLANHVAKKHPRSKGVFDYNSLSESQQSSLLSRIDVGDVWGIGRRLAAKLRPMQIETVLQLRDADIAAMRAQFGVVMEKSIRELRGEECLSVEEVEPPRKQIVSSRSFGDPVIQIEDLDDAIGHFVTTAAGKLRGQRSTASMLQVFIMTDRFRQDRPQYSPTFSVAMPQATADTRVIAGYASMALKRIYKTGYQYKKAGVVLSQIGPEHIVQIDLFAEAPSASNAILMATLDAVNGKYGKGTLKLGNDSASKAWAMRSENRSPRYTTVWAEIATCR